jgi:tetratricopeptide (TPR) repeat protein
MRAVRDLAAAYEMHGMAKVMANDYPGARESYENFRLLVVPLSDSDPDNTHLSELSARSYERFAELSEKEGDHSAAVRNYREALLIVEPLVAADPENFDRKVQEARLLAGLGGVLALTGDNRAEARARLETARQRYEALLAIQPEMVELHEGLEKTLDRLSQPTARAASGQAQESP